MKVIRDDIMGMPITVEIISTDETIVNSVFAYFINIDNRFSTYKPESEVMQLNRREIISTHCSSQLQEILMLSEQTTRETDGYFSMIKPDGSIDPSGIVKGWAIQQASELVESLGCENYFIDAGGDIQSKGFDDQGQKWTVGIRHPFEEHKIVKVLTPEGQGVATSGTTVRGQHIYNPHTNKYDFDKIISLTVIGPNIYEADRFATGAFAMGEQGVHFIEALNGFEAYQIDQDGIAIMTTGFNKYTI